jgi:TonB-linked SusC/RagA family outer membrane protein
MKKILLILCFLASTSVFAQKITITGTVSDEKGAPLPGATVQVKGATLGTTTGADGKFSLDVSGTNLTLVFSFVGYVAKEIPVQNQTTINVSLAPDVMGLQEVVVVGYGTQKKSDITGTVASLPQERLEMAPNINITQAIQGSIAGVQVSTSSSGAVPGQTILVRGRNSITANNDPLIIVDGIPYGGGLTDINPNDVKSIEVLKDASAAAIYGSRGANGVILVTTKEGIEGKATFSYEGKFSITDVTKVNRMLTGPEFYDFKMTRNAASMTASEKQVYQDGSWTDYTKLAIRQGQTQEHNLSVSGGLKDTKYYIGGGFTDIKGVALNDNFRRFSSRINVETKITKWLSIGTRTQFTYDDASGAEANFHVALETNPLSHAYDDYGNLTIFPWPDNIIVGNPLQNLLYDDLNKAYQILSNNYAIVDFPFVKGLSYRLNSGIRARFTDQARYEGRDTQSGLAALGDASIDNSVSNNVVLENILSYNREFGSHSIFATGLYSYEGYNGRTNSMDAQNFPNDFLSWYGIAQAAVVAPSVSYSKTALISQMLRFNYTYASRYLLTLTMRRDGYSGFGEDTKWGTFPSAALGWNLANEGFFPVKSTVNTFKLRASYGLNGNQAIGAYESLPKFTVANMSTNSGTVIGYKPSKMGVANLGWESSATLNLGFDFGLFKDRVSGNFNWYLTNTSDLLLARSISVNHGITPNTHLPSWTHPAVTENIGETQNKGVEVVIDSRNIVKGKFQWNMSANFSYNKNKIVSLYGVKDTEGKEVDDISNKWFIGQPIRVNYDYVWDGVWQSNDADTALYGTHPGYVKLKDVNGDKVLDSKDRQIIGQLDPSILWGLTNTFTYSNFTLSIFIHGVSGSTVQNYLMNDDVQGAEVRYNTLKKNWWSKTNPTNDWIANALLANNMSGQSGRIYEKPDFVRIKDISLGYDLPKNMVGKIGLSRVKVYVTFRNLLTFTKWTGMDPDLTDEQAQQRIPMQKEYVFGMSFGF